MHSEQTLVSRLARRRPPLHCHSRTKSQCLRLIWRPWTSVQHDRVSDWIHGPILRNKAEGGGNSSSTADEGTKLLSFKDPTLLLFLRIFLKQLQKKIASSYFWEVAWSILLLDGHFFVFIHFYRANVLWWEYVNALVKEDFLSPSGTKYSILFHSILSIHPSSIFYSKYEYIWHKIRLLD